MNIVSRGKMEILLTQGSRRGTRRKAKFRLGVFIPESFPQQSIFLRGEWWGGWVPLCGLRILAVGACWKQVGPVSLQQDAQPVGQARPELRKSLGRRSSEWGRYSLPRWNPEATERILEKHWLKLGETELCSLTNQRQSFLFSGLKSKMRFFAFEKNQIIFELWCVTSALLYF